MSQALPEFRALVDEFFDFVDPTRGNYIAMFSEHLRMTAEFSKLPRLDLLYVREAFGHVQTRLARFAGDPSDFCLLVNELNSVLKLHHDAVVLWPLDSLRDFPMEKITTSHRESYRNLRRKYEAFLERYQAFSKKVNLAFERNVSQPYFRDLPEL